MLFMQYTVLGCWMFLMIWTSVMALHDSMHWCTGKWESIDIARFDFMDMASWLAYVWCGRCAVLNAVDHQVGVPSMVHPARLGAASPIGLACNERFMLRRNNRSRCTCSHITNFPKTLVQRPAGCIAVTTTMRLCWILIFSATLACMDLKCQPFFRLARCWPHSAASGDTGQLFISKSVTCPLGWGFNFCQVSCHISRRSILAFMFPSQMSRLDKVEGWSSMQFHPKPAKLWQHIKVHHINWWSETCGLASTFILYLLPPHSPGYQSHLASQCQYFLLIFLSLVWVVLADLNCVNDCPSSHAWCQSNLGFLLSVHGLNIIADIYIDIWYKGEQDI